MDKLLLTYKGIKKILLMIGVLTFLQGVIIVLQAIYLSKSITALFHGTAWTAVLPYLFYFAALFLLRHFLQWIKERVSYNFAEKTAMEKQSQLLQKLFEIGPHAVSKHGTGNMITLCMEGIPNFRKYLELFIPRFISMLVIPAIILLYVFSSDTLSGVVLLVTMPIMFVFLALLGMAAKKKVDDQMGTYRILSHHFVDSLRGIVTLKYLGRSKSHSKAIEHVSNQYRIATNQTLRVAFLSSFSLNFFSSLSIALLAVELGVRLIDGTTGLEIALAMLILAPEYFSPVREFGNDFHATMDGKDAGTQIHQLLTQETIPLVEKKVDMTPWNEKSSLHVENLSKMADDEDRYIMKDVHFQVKGFKKIGVIGASGAGKSTLIDLLAGFTAPNSGSIKVNDQTIPHFAIPEWQEQLTYIPQHPYIFSGTIAENVCWYTPDAPKDAINEALRITGLTELITKLPKGMDEKIGQGGRSLSGGEEQRIALARAILKEQPIMVFDEPTAHLDIETEHDIKQMMLPIMENKLIFFATHRLHWIQNMDLILVMDNGRLVEIGTPKELYDERGFYYQLIGGEMADEALSEVY
ncbi:thiol reductant ABC exporter subunit CydD [Oceanobacillus halophilus]|uniref:Thiol reductant ABC exporter subunit CydD n=1 Tax=Oceanobacillus halophilus TaxID=930130 RepID=A0A495A106_9BACI|nr:thiol reductant ABC exporter subunit CydD [Oceanobacillus halophilus]RKQ33160.1 thiol reductant ABC exporter subunit CydD [Oceanobacillus halophilus]